MPLENVYTTKMSSKGQIVIPENIRDSLGLTAGTQFVVVGKGDTVILKLISPPPLEELQELLIEARKSAKKTKLKKTDVLSTIRKVRRK